MYMYRCLPSRFWMGLRVGPSCFAMRLAWLPILADWMPTLFPYLGETGAG